MKTEFLMPGDRVLIRVPTYPTVSGTITGESRDRRCWWVTPAGRKTPVRFHKSFVKLEPTLLTARANQLKEQITKQNGFSNDLYLQRAARSVDTAIMWLMFFADESLNKKV